MDVSEAKRLKALEDESAKLKKLLAEQMLDIAWLREFLAKNGKACILAGRCHATDGRHGLSERRARQFRLGTITENACRFSRSLSFHCLIWLTCTSNC
jgi:hypothetical protein